MKKRTYLLLVASAAAIGFQFLIVENAPAQRIFERKSAIPQFSYAAKFVCGRNPGKTDRVIPGVYASAINIHNPGSQPVTFRKKVALTFPPVEQRPGEVSKFITDTLGPDEALEVDCGEIPSGFQFATPPTTPYVKGFLIIISPRSLDVTAVYTAGGADAAGLQVTVQSIDVEHIKERR